MFGTPGCFSRRLPGAMYVSQPMIGLIPAYFMALWNS